MEEQKIQQLTPEQAVRELIAFSAKTVAWDGTSLIIIPGVEDAVVLKTDFPESFFGPGYDFAWNIFSFFEGSEVHVFLQFKALNLDKEFNFHLRMSSESDRGLASLLIDHPTVGIMPGADIFKAMTIGTYKPDQIAVLKAAVKFYESRAAKRN